MNKKELSKQIKELALHFGEYVSCEWLSADRQDWTEWHNTEINVPFLINVEKGYVRNIQMHHTMMAVQAEWITTFETFEEWADKAPSDVNGRNPGEVVYVGQNHKALLSEADFLFARDNGLFPVRAYRMMGNTDIQDNNNSKTN